MKGLLPALLFVGIGLSSCTAEEETSAWRLYSAQEPHMGTEYKVMAYAEQGKGEELTLLIEKAFARVEKLNLIFSDYLPESELNDLARAPIHEAIPVSDDLFQILQLGKALSEETEGAFDVTAGPLIRLWRRARKNQALPTPDQIAKAKARTGSHLIELDPEAQTVTKRAKGMLFDLGGIAKGYAADAALQVLRDGGFPHSLVAASGDIVVGDSPPGKEGWKIGIETLEVGNDSSEIDTVLLVNQAISTSADTRQFLELEGKRYSHIVSTKTGLGLTERIGASVVAKTATTTDSYATALTLLGAGEGLRWIQGRQGVEARVVFIRGDQETIQTTPGFPPIR